MVNIHQSRPTMQPVEDYLNMFSGRKYVLAYWKYWLKINIVQQKKKKIQGKCIRRAYVLGTFHFSLSGKEVPTAICPRLQFIVGHCSPGLDHRARLSPLRIRPPNP